MQQLHIGLDLDGPFYGFAEAFTDYLVNVRCFPAGRARLGKLRWEFYKDLGLSDEDFFTLASGGVDDGWIFWQGTPHEGSVEGARRLADAGHRLHVITDRSAFGSPGRAEDATRTWLHQVDIPFDTLTMSADKTIVRTDVMVEDKPANYFALVQAGTDAYLVDKPWNAGTTAWRHARATGRLVDGVAEFADLVLTRAAA